MVDLRDDFWIQKGERGKGRKKDGAKTAVAKIQSCQIAFNLRLIAHLGERAALASQAWVGGRDSHYSSL